MHWTYKGREYESIFIDWEEMSLSSLPIDSVLDSIMLAYAKPNNPDKYLHSFLVYVPIHDKCYAVQSFGIFGKGNHLKFKLEDIYTGCLYYCNADKVELVIHEGNILEN